MVNTAAFHARVRGSVPGLGGLKETKLFLPHPRVKVSIVGSLRDREVACSASDRQGSNFESCVWRTVSSQSSHHPQEVLLAQFSLYVHKGGLKPDSFHFFASSSAYTALFHELGPHKSLRLMKSRVFQSIEIEGILGMLHAEEKLVISDVLMVGCLPLLHIVGAKEIEIGCCTLSPLLYTADAWKQVICLS